MYRKVPPIDIGEFKNDYSTYSLTEMASKYDCSKKTIANRAKKFGLYKFHPELPFTLTEKQKSIFVGSLLGDGTLHKTYGLRNTYFGEGHSIKQEKYLRWKFQEFLPFSANFRHIQNKPFGRDTVHILCMMETYVSPIFKDAELQWYKRDEGGNYVFRNNGRRIKIVPTDIVLDPISLTVWYLDDGFISVRDREIHICTDGFTYDECNFLTDIIKSTFSIRYARVIPTPANREQFNIVISRTSFLDFIDLVSPHIPTSDMQYKVDLTNYIHPLKRLTDIDVVCQIREMADTHTYLEISRITGVNKNTIASIVQGRSHRITKPIN